MSLARLTRQAAWIVLLAVCGAISPAPGQEKSNGPSPPAAVRQFRDAVAFQDRTVYDLAADEWEAFLKAFPQDPLASKARHYLGLCRLLLKEYDAAVAHFRRAIREFPDSELADASYLNLGLAQYSLAQGGNPAAYDEAAGTFGTLVEKFSKSKELPQALYYQGEALYARGHKQQAADAYARLIEKFPQAPLRPDALYALGVARGELDKIDEAGAAYDQFLKEYPEHKLRPEVILRRAETLFAQEKFDVAARWFASAAAAKDFALADLAAMRQAQSLEAAGKPGEAAALYATIPERFGQSTYRSSALLAAGNARVAAGDLQAAVEPFTSVINSGGELADDAAHWLARAYLKQNQPDQALATAESALGKSPDAQAAVRLQMDRADALFEIAERRGESIPVYAALATEHPDDELAPQALYMAAYASLGQGDFAAAADFGREFLAAHADKPLAAEVRYVAAEAALQLQQYDGAARQYAELLDSFPDHADAPRWKVRRGLALHLGQKFDDVAGLLAPVADKLPTPELTAQAQFLLGSAQGELGHRQQAERALRAALVAQPEGRYADEALLSLAAVERQGDRLPEAIATLQKLLDGFPHSALLDQACFRLAEYETAAGQLAEAAGHYRQVVEKWPQSDLVAAALYGLASTQLSQRQPEAADEALSRLLTDHAQHPLAPQAHYARAMAREQQGDYAAAAEDIAAFLSTNPPPDKQLDALYLQGLCLAGQNQFDQAAEAFRTILARDAKFAAADKVLYELAWALRSAGDEAGAHESFARLVSQHAQSPLATEGLYHLGEHAYQSQDYAAAAAQYTQARDRAGANDLGEKAGHKLGWSLYQQGKLDDAAQAFQRELQDFPQGELAADAQFMLAESLFAQKQYEQAWAEYEKSFAHSGGNREFQALARLHAAQALAQQKKWDESLALLDEALDKYADSAYVPELRYESGWAQQNLGQLQEATRRYEQVVAETDREVSARARFMIGEILFEKREYKEAIRNFFKVAYGYGYPQSPDSVHVWQANASYEAGRCFEVLKMVDQAKKSYQEVVDRYPKSDKAPLAQDRLEALGA